RLLTRGNELEQRARSESGQHLRRTQAPNLGLDALHARRDDCPECEAAAHSLGEPLGDVEDRLLLQRAVACEARRREMRQEPRVVRLELPRAEKAEDARLGLELDAYVVVAGVQQIGREA